MINRIVFSKATALSFIMALMLILSSACSKTDNNTAVNGSINQGSDANNGAGTAEQTESLQVVTSFYPLYFMASEIGGERVDVVNLIAAGVEPHDWTPKSRDLTAASNAQLFLYHGAGLEGWVDDFLKGLSKDSQVLTKEMSQGIALIEGEDDGHGHGDAHEEEHEDEHMHEEEHAHADDHAHEDDHEEDHADDHAHEEEQAHEDDHGHSHSHGIDPHTWVSPKSALILAENVKDSIIEADPANEAYYMENYEALKAKLDALDQKYSTNLAQVSQKNIVVSHQAFGYLARDYGLNQLSIMGLSPDAEPLAQDILKIAKFVKDNGVKYIFFEELVSDKMAQMLASEAKVDTMVLNPLEGLTKEQEKAGETYLTLMERNLQNLIQALQ